jgi:hypothetical protein
VHHSKECALMSQMGPPDSDTIEQRQHFRVVPKAVVSRCSNGKTELFDHLVGAGQESLWDREAERLGRVEIDDEIELGWLLDRNFGGF